MTTAGATRKLKVLMAHGYTSNQFQFFKRSGAIRKACRDVADFTFINGPLIVRVGDSEHEHALGDEVCTRIWVLPPEGGDGVLPEGVDQRLGEPVAA